MSTAFNRLERQKSDLLSEVQHWPEVRLAYQPRPESWSTLNVIDHLVKVESGIVNQIKKTLATNQRVRLQDRLGTAFMYLVMRSPMRVKVPPTAAQSLPQGAPGIDVLSESWSKTRANMKQLLESIQADQMSCAAFLHPVSGRMNLIQTLAFLADHQHHHSYQIARLKTASQKLG